jgi:hypothetical protein
MAFNYFYTFSAPKSVPVWELEMFLKKVEREAQALGFTRTKVVSALYTAIDEINFTRKITVGLVVDDPRLRGVTLRGAANLLIHDPKRGECRVLPEKGVILVTTDTPGREVVFGFLWYPDTLIDLSSKEVASVPHQGRWYFHDFVESPDKRYRTIVKMFADAGYLESSRDEYAAK